jgi:glucose 1-dehydrogenase
LSTDPAHRSRRVDPGLRYPTTLPLTTDPASPEPEDPGRKPQIACQVFLEG